MEHFPSTENIQMHNSIKEEFNSLKNKEIQKSWHEKTSTLNMEKDTTKLWKLTEALDDDCTQSYAKAALNGNGHLHTGRMAANVLAEAFEDVSKVNMSMEKNKRGKQRQKGKPTFVSTQRLHDS